MSATICLHHHYGHCKYGIHCRNQHVEETCENYPCPTKTCNKRHPKICRYFSLTGACKFNKNCSFLHRHRENTKIDDLEKDVKKLKEEIEALTTEVSLLKKNIHTLSKSSQSIESDPSTSLKTTSNSTISVTALKSTDFSNPDTIPQLDGLQQEPQYQYQLQQAQNTSQNLQCETCRQVFHNSEDFKEHDALQFCCDDCGICCATQVQADIHV